MKEDHKHQGFYQSAINLTNEELVMSNFEEDLAQRVQNSILKQVEKIEWLAPPSYQERKVIPKEFIEKIWAGVNWDAVIEEIKPEIHRRICNAIMGNMETEIKTDVKNLMSVAGVREKLRIEIYPRLMSILESEKK